MANYHDKIKDFLLSDINPDIVLLHKTVKDYPNRLIENITAYCELYNNQIGMDNKRYIYNEFVSRYNNNHCIQANDTVAICQFAALVLFLNKTCFNGLYRLNNNREFNSSFGKKESINIAKIIENITACSKVYTDQSLILAINYAEITDYIGPILGPNTFMYLDPPYTPTSSTANFTGYFGNSFNMIEFKSFVDTANARGTKIMISNSDTTESRNMFSAFNVHQVSINRNLAGDSSARGITKELLITNY